MISWKSLLLVTLLVGEAFASHNEARHHPRSLHAAPERRLSAGLSRRSCRAPTSSSSTQSSSSTTHTTSSTKAATTTKSSSSNSGSSGSSSSSISSVKAAAGYTPNQIKAGTSSGNAFSSLKNHIGWWYDWTPNPPQNGNPIPVPMLWGAGGADSTDSSRLAQFKKITKAPQYMLGFEEPDCPSGGGSAGMSVSEGVSVWEEYIAPFKAKGTKLGSPSMCKQAAETWLKDFSEQITTDWDFTAVHINKNNMDGVRADLNHYASYGKPIWVTEFACVDDQNGFTPSEDQDEINQYINDIVDLFESDSRVAAYAYSNGYGLGSTWPMTKSDGSLSESGQTYINAISKYH